MAKISSAVGFIPMVDKAGTLAKAGGKLGAKAMIKDAAKYTVKETMKGAGMYEASSITSGAIAEYNYDTSTDIFSIVISENVFNILMEYSKYEYSPIDLKIIRKARSYYTQKIYGMFRA